MARAHRCTVEELVRGELCLSAPDIAPRQTSAQGTFFTSSGLHDLEIEPYTKVPRSFCPAYRMDSVLLAGRV